MLAEALDHFQPDVVHVFSLAGLSKSLIFSLRAFKLPVVYDVFDHWLSANVREDPWLQFWNAPTLPLLRHSARKVLEASGERGRMDSCAPTRMMKGYERIPAIFGDGQERANVQPDTVAGFNFDRTTSAAAPSKN